MIKKCGLCGVAIGGHPLRKYCYKCAIKRMNNKSYNPSTDEDTSHNSEGSKRQ